MNPNQRQTLSLPMPPETSMVKEAKDIARHVDDGPDLTNWTLRLLEDRQAWENSRRGRR